MWWVGAPTAAFQLLLGFYFNFDCDSDDDSPSALTSPLRYTSKQPNGREGVSQPPDRKLCDWGWFDTAGPPGGCMGQDRQPLANFILVVSVSTTRRPDSRDCLVLPLA
ncbi:hypothetical protein F4678DRAFT_53669 [Xylaria arbuscula]|nr:hypothetical protein F4678DRAFT_53669 [Xylaria arbuscula]